MQVLHTEPYKSSPEPWVNQFGQWSHVGWMLTHRDELLSSSFCLDPRYLNRFMSGHSVCWWLGVSELQGLNPAFSRAEENSLSPFIRSHYPEPEHYQNQTTKLYSCTSPRAMSILGACISEMDKYLVEVGWSQNICYEILVDISR